MVFATNLESAARFDGAPYSPLVHTGGLIVAPDRDCWGALHAALLAEAPPPTG